MKLYDRQSCKLNPIATHEISGNTLILEECYKTMVIKLEFSCSTGWKLQYFFLYTFVCPIICVFQYWKR